MKAVAAHMRQVRLNRPEDIVTTHQSPLYDPTDPFYCLFNQKDKKYIVLYGGRGGRKTWSIAEYIVRRMAKEKILVLCGREYQNTIADSVHRVLVGTIERLGYNGLFRTTASTIRSNTGSEVIYKGLHNAVSEIKSTEDVDICWLEEGQTLTKLTLQTVGPTIRKKGSQIIISFNPKNRNDPVYDRFIVVGDDDAHVVQVNFDSNPYMSGELEKERQQALRAIERATNDEERKQAQADYDWIWLGQLHEISNEIIFAGKVVIEEFPDDLWKKAPRLLLGEDFGFAQDPGAIVRSFIYEDCLYIEYEAFGTGIDFMGNVQEGKGEFERFHEQIPDIKRWPIKCDAARPETISFLRGLGFNATAAEKWDGSVEDGIAHIRGFRRIIIHPRCKHMAFEAKNYKYKIDRTTGEVLPIIIDKHNHGWDAVRYSLDGYIQRRGDLGVWYRLAQGSPGFELPKGM